MASYDIVAGWRNFPFNDQAQIISAAALTELEKWASDPERKQQVLCLRELTKRRAGTAESSVPGWTPAMSEATPTSAPQAERSFDARSDVSADAKHIAWAVESSGRRIVMHLWILFVALPVVLGILYAILMAK